MDTRLGRRIAVATGVLLFPLGGWAEPAPSGGGVFSGIHDGDRVRVELSTGSPVSGIVKAVTADAITLDLRLEERGMEGDVQLPARQVLRADVLPAWDAEELAKRRAARFRHLVELEKQRQRDAAKRAAASRVEGGAGAPMAVRGNPAPPADSDLGGLTPDEFRKGVALILKFPPQEGWGTSPDKTAAWLRVKFAVIGALLTPEEREFLEHYDLWSRMKTLSEAAWGKPAAPRAPVAGSQKDAWLYEKQAPDLPMESPPAAMLPPAFPE